MNQTSSFRLPGLRRLCLFGLLALMLAAGVPAADVPPAGADKAAVPLAVTPQAGAASSAVAPAAAAPAIVAPAASDVRGCVRLAGASSSSCDGPALQLLHVRARLPDATASQPYGPLPLALGGLPPYTLTALEGRWPEWLLFDRATGQLRADAPPAAGRHLFTVSVVDSGATPQTLRQAYELVVRPAPRPAAPRPPVKAASAPPPAPVISLKDADRRIQDVEAGQFTLYRLTQADIDTLAPDPAGAQAPAPGSEPPAPVFSLDALRQMLLALKLPGGELPPDVPAEERWMVDGEAAATGKAARAPARADAPPPRPTDPAQLRDLMLPLLDREYPSRELFVAALVGQQCTYFRELAGAALKKPVDESPVKNCRFRTPVEPVRVKPGEITLQALHESLLPPPLREEIADRAIKRYRLDQPGTLAWAEDDCGCVRWAPDDAVFGFMPFWHAGVPAPVIDFSRFHRVSVLGAQLDDRGQLMLPRSWERLGTLARQAQRHGTRMDLVVERARWDVLLDRNPDALAALWRDSAEATLRQLDTDRMPAHVGPLLPFWREPARTFGGVTVMFHDAPLLDVPERGPRFAQFFIGYMRALIAGMQQRPNDAYELNVVIPDHLLGLDGAYSWRNLMEIIESAEAPDNPFIPEGSERENYRGTTDITVHFLVPLREATTDTKKALRARIDYNEVASGHRRVALLKSVMPVVLAPAAAAPLPVDRGASAPPPPPPPPVAVKLAPDARDRLDQDLSYYSWNYGGVAFWPLPSRGAGAGQDVIDLLVDNHPNLVVGPNTEGLCRLVCPNRSWIRLVFELLLASSLGALALYKTSCRVRRLGRRFLLLLWVLGALTLVCGAALYSCDPKLQRVRDGKEILFVLLFVVAVAGAWFSFKPRTPIP